jgi:peptide/nickel transport system substrate-binding protein
MMKWSFPVMTKNALMGCLRAVLFTVITAASIAAGAAVLRIANQGDILSMDPHARNEGLQLAVLLNIYEPLVSRDRTYRLVPALATDWTLTAPTIWQFNLRQGVRFHDGTPFTADDVIFSLGRAGGPHSAMKSYVDDIAQVRAINTHAVEIVTRAPQPILPQLLLPVFMMSRKWCEANQATTPADGRRGIENAASFKANGTGPFQLRERRPDVQTRFTRNESYWGKLEGNVDDVRFMPLANDSTRLAALLSGEVDVIDPLPVQDVERVKGTPGLRVLQGPEQRIIFLGMDQGRDELLYSSIKGKNPFKDRRVRQAFYQAIDVDAIRATVMRGAASPAALLIAPGVTGYPEDLAGRLPFDVAAARKLLAQAGYPQGFELKMNCPNDRYVNDGAICQAVAASLARIGIKIALEVETKTTFFPKLMRRNTSFYLFGFSSGTGDAHIVMNALMASPGEGGRGQFNLGSYSNVRFDQLTEQIAVETDPSKRSELIREALNIHQHDIGHIPLHQQALSWGVRNGIELVQWPDDGMPWRYIKVQAR